MNEPTATRTNGVAPKAVSSSAAPETVFEVAAESIPTALDVIDKELKHNKKLTELERAVLVTQREKLHLAEHLAPRAFANDTELETGINQSTVRRLRRIGRLSAEVREVLVGTKIADRQDLLEELSNQCDGKTPEVQMAYTQALIANPPKRGPRASTKDKVTDAPDAEQEKQGPAHAIVPFTFNGDALEVVRLPDGDVGVVFRRLCEIVGIGTDSQLKRLARTAAAGARWAVTVVMTVTGADAKTYEMAVLPRRSIPMWAATLNASRCAPMAQPKLVRYQDEAADVLAEAFLPGNAAMSKLNDKLNALDNHITRLSVWLGNEVVKRLTHLEHSGFGTRTMLLVPQIAPEESGYSMESMNKYLIEKGYNISPTDTAIRSIAAKMKLIGDTTYGFWNAHNDGVGRSSSLSESWRFNDTGTQAIQEHAVVFCELKAKHEAAGETAPRETALKEALDKVSAIGNGTYELLTRTRAARRPPFPTIRGPENNG